MRARLRSCSPATDRASDTLLHSAPALPTMEHTINFTRQRNAANYILNVAPSDQSSTATAVGTRDAGAKKMVCART